MRVEPEIYATNGLYIPALILSEFHPLLVPFRTDSTDAMYLVKVESSDRKLVIRFADRVEPAD